MNIVEKLFHVAQYYGPTSERVYLDLGMASSDLAM